MKHPKKPSDPGPAPTNCPPASELYTSPEAAPIRAIPATPQGEDDSTLCVHMVLKQVAALRTVRDSRTYKAEGYHSFREWCVDKFGERLGGAMEDIL
jgi:hypothetical protein